MTGLFKNSYFRSLVIFTACLFSYSNALNNEFAMDDHGVLFGESGLKSFNSVFSVFSKDIYGFYRPFAFSVLKFFNIAFGGHAFYYHIANLLLFYTICLLFFKLIKLLTNDDKLALLVSLLYCVHPINNMIVNFKVASTNAVFVIFQQLCVICFLKSFEERGRPNYFASLFFYLAALLSHEVGCLTPIYLFLIAHFLKRTSLRRSLYLCLPYLVVFIAYYFVRLTVGMPLGRTSDIGSIFHLGLSMGAYIGVMARLILWYLSKLLLPVNLLINWDVPLGLNYSLLLNTAFVVSVLALIVIASLKKNLICFSLALFISGFMVLPVASFVYSHLTKTAIINPHWFYFSSIGFFILAAKSIIYLSARIRFAVRPFLFILLILVILSGLTRKSNVVWATEEDYCSYWLSINKFNPDAEGYLIDKFLRENDRGLDSRAYNTVHEVCLIGWNYFENDELEKSLMYFDLALSMDKDSIEAYISRGNVYEFMDQYDKAISDYNRVIEINPKYISAYKNLTIIYLYEHEYGKAWENVHRAESLGATIDPEVLEDLKKASGREK